MFKKNISILTILFLFFGCAAKEDNIKLTSYPHYNKDKVNLYLLNNETSMGLQLHFNYKVSSENSVKDILTCYGQYSYQELDEGNYIVEVKSSEFQALGKRDDHISYKNHLKTGEVYFLKPFPTTDMKAIGKQLFSIFTISPDAQLEVKEISKEDGLKEIGIASQFKGGAFGRYPLRAEDNPSNKTCLEILLNKAL